MKGLRFVVFCLGITILTPRCSTHPLPQTRYRQFDTGTSIRYEKDTLHYHLRNTLKCPLRFYITGEGSLKNIGHITLPAGKDTLIHLPASAEIANTATVRTAFGDLNQKIIPNKMSLPFPSGRSCELVQGYNGSYSHEGDYARYSLDFSLKTGDTVCAADAGYVVGIINDYKRGGDSSGWRDFSNFITIYHPHSGLFTQYVHLKQKGSLVAIGDMVERGQPIGLSGKTGWTNIEHLHFNVLVSADTDEGLKGLPVEFQEGYNGLFLHNGDTVTKK